MKYFIVAADSPTQEQQNQITSSFKDSGYSWWHWLPDFWILGCPYDGVQAPTIRDHIKELVPGLVFLVLGADPRPEWGAFSSPEWWQWLNDNWKKE
jgi:hypothetical protein